ncbi:hypothetical protein CIPAW_04G114900 [Carya illinoinensis]|uniref:Uncharacterized protein n=1 Tax=Carya illinoinensis TaxID=32201 RepID=A0A8T1QU81_CARIL|nr:hypothetical protein CIPAW_04G114900 [Carya illinoinensis]KAG6717685.1 hypothetical protein I3842_04G113200 [Carya illinoinensis]
MGVVKAAIGDAILTSLWVFSAPMMGILTPIIAAYLGLQAIPVAGLFIATALATTLVFLFSLIGKALGGASFNPSTTVSFYAAGLNPDSSIISMATRFPAQAAGGVGGAMAILRVMPSQYKHMLRGPSLKVDMHTGAVAEGSGYTGPSMNPANAFGWAFLNNQHSNWVHFYVYWICPLIGATLAAWIFRFIFIPTIKHKKA